MSRNQIVPVEGGDMYVVQDGPPDAPAVVLIHGYAGSTRWWDLVVPPLAAAHRVVRVDLLGHGRSSSPRRGYGMARQAARVGSVIDRLDIGPAVVIGHSTGGAVATALAEVRRVLVRRLVPIDTGPDPGARRPQGLASRVVSVRGLGSVAWRMRTDASIRKGLEDAVSGGSGVSDQIASDVKSMRYQAFSQTPRAMMAYIGERSVPARLADLDVSAHVIFGVEDRRWRSSAAQDYRTIGGAEVELLPGIGHTPMLESPRRTSDLLAQLVQ